LSLGAQILSKNKRKLLRINRLYILAIICSFEEFNQVINHVVAIIAFKFVFFRAETTRFSPLPVVFNQGSVSLRTFLLVNRSDFNNGFLTPVKHKVISHSVTVDLFVVGHVSYCSDEKRDEKLARSYDDEKL